MSYCPSEHICLVCFGGEKVNILGGKGSHSKSGTAFQDLYDKKSLTIQSLCELSLYLERGNGIVSIGFSFIIVTL